MDKETAMKILKVLYNNSLSAERTALKTIIPELEESEDERMVKFIKKQLFNIKKTITENYELDAKLTKAIDWLGKQGDDVKKIKELEDKIESLQKCFKIANDEIANKSQELYALKCKIEDEAKREAEKKPVAWSEEDNTFFKAIIRDIENIQYINEDAKKDRINWIKSIKERYTWKPTEKQLISLSCAIAALDAEDDDLASLYEILKKL